MSIHEFGHIFNFVNHVTFSLGDLQIQEAEDWVGYFIQPPPKTIPPNTAVSWELSYAAIPNDHVSLGMEYMYNYG